MVVIKCDGGSDSPYCGFFNPCQKWEQPKQLVFTAVHLTIITIPINPSRPMRIIASNKDFGPNISEKSGEH